MTHDPLTDPREGDVVEAGPHRKRERYQVLNRYDNGAVGFKYSGSPENPTHRFHRNSEVRPLRLWREYMEGGRVIHIAGEPISDEKLAVFENFADSITRELIAEVRKLRREKGVTP